MLRLLIKYKAKEGKAREFISYIKDSGILDSIKKDEGYISYNYYIDAFDEDTILLLEEWKDRECQQKHIASPHMKALLEKKKDYIIETAEL